MNDRTRTDAIAVAARPSGIALVIATGVRWMQAIPYSAIALLGRFSIAAVFWNSGQTKVAGFAINIVSGTFHWGWPHLSDSAIALFQDEYKLPLLPPDVAAPMAAFAEHAFPVLLLVGLGTRFAAVALLGMTLVIQLFVYPGAYPMHGTWATILLMLMAQGPGRASIDDWISRRYRVCP